MDSFKLILLCTIFFISLYESDAQGGPIITIPPTSKVCGPNEEPTNCAPCDGTCNNTAIACPEFCIVGRTFCKCLPGYVRDSNNNCIPQAQCNITCANKKCQNGTICKMIWPFCPAGKNPCRPVAICEPSPSNQTSCADITCNQNETCVLRNVTCVRAPCNPVPTCVPKQSNTIKPCIYLCIRGFHCVNGQCVPEITTPNSIGDQNYDSGSSSGEEIIIVL